MLLMTLEGILEPVEVMEEAMVVGILKEMVCRRGGGVPE